MSAWLDKIEDLQFSKTLAKLLIPHKHNNYHAHIIRHEGLFAITLLIMLVQFFSFSQTSSARVLGYATNITKEAIISLTNQERTSRGLTPLVENNQLDQSATMKNQHMFANDYWAHYAPDGTSPWYFFKQVGYKYSWAGENLARDFSTSEGVVNGWMNSPSHRDNMLNPNFIDIGIGIGDGTLLGTPTTLVVEHMGKTLGASTSVSKSANTPTPKVTAQPTPVEATLKTTSEKPSQPTASANVNQVNEKIAGAESTGFNLANFWKNLGFGQKSTLLLLIILVSAFIFDSLLLLRRGNGRNNSHSLLHTGVLLILMFVLIKGATGGIL